MLNVGEKVTGCQAENAKYLEKKYAAVLEELVYTNDPKYTEEELEQLDKIEELRQMIYVHNNGDDYFETRTDDDFLMKFLRAKEYNVESAFNQIKNYQSFLSRHYTWREVQMDMITKALGSGTVNVLEQRDIKNRRILWFRAANWQPLDVSPDQLLQIGILCAELGVLEPSTQRSGLALIFDLKDFGLSHLRYITPSFARRMVFIMAECLPLKITAVHIVNEPSPFSLLFSIYKKFLNEKISERIFFHGQSLSSLHEHIEPEILPVELGGTQLHDPKKYLALTEVPSIIKELESLNYSIVEHGSDLITEEDG
ncbi:alpha-tocopherol transfer protein-like isoform X2 [Lycorma delicatula]|uniref:alpha-tocopherol transfer protein-like isoform X2 n=1 Tax=Lycorma delicatula TaxID=130591 RepID=UPI003F51482B